jgi:membrane protease YdiL (CAAX protease family)
MAAMESSTGVPQGDTGIIVGARPSFTERFRIPITLVALVAWVLITSIDPFHTRRAGGFTGALTASPQWSILAAGLFLVILVAICHWRGVALLAPISPRGLLILWLPAVYLLFFLGLDVALSLSLGRPRATVVGFLLLNSALAAFSEELMFRGVLFSALVTRLRPFAAILITTLLFGLVHLLNAGVVGNIEVAAAQAVAAAMSGLLFIAIRVRTGSIIPAMVYHALWDFGALMAVAMALSAADASGNGGAVSTATAGGTPPGLLLAPIVLLLPNFLYALSLFRRRKATPT